MDKPPCSSHPKQQGVRDSQPVGVVLALAAAADVAKRVASTSASKSEAVAPTEGPDSAPNSDALPVTESSSPAPKSEVAAATEGAGSAPTSEAPAAREDSSSDSKSEVVALREVGNCAPKSEVMEATEGGSWTPKSEAVEATEGGSCAPKPEVMAVTAGSSCAPNSEARAASEPGSCAPKSEVVVVRESDSCAPKSEIVARSCTQKAEVMGATASGPKMEVEAAAPVVNGAVLKRKRGRPAKGVKKSATPATARQKMDEEDVCFICFDGGSLVLCDRRGCPKAYHPSCVKRDDAFFRSKAKWNCGWHICSVCQKNAHYMCYTCTYSLCKGCIKNADFACVRENKGLCGMCMRTIMLIEKPAEGNKPMDEVDFDDKGSWEYLFKVYWVCLKDKLSLTLDELLQAKNPWKGAAPTSCKVETPHGLYRLNDDKGSGSDNSCIDVESDYLENKKPKIVIDNQRFIWNGVSSYVGCSAQDLTTTSQPINPNGVAVAGSANVGVVKSEASDAALCVSSLFSSTGMEQPFNDFVTNQWHYQDPTGKVQGPFSMLQLYKWSVSGHFPSDLRIWGVDEKQENSILLIDALSGRCSKNVPLQCNSQKLPSGTSVTFNGKDNFQTGLRNETVTEIHADSQIIRQSDIQKMDDTCTQSNVKGESVQSKGLGSHSSSGTLTAYGNNEGQNGNSERREQSSECEISRHNQPHSLPAPTFMDKLNENPSNILRDCLGIEGNSEDNGNHGSNGTPEGHTTSGQSCQKQSESEENSGQSSGHSWECPNVIHPSNTSMWHAIFGEPTDFNSLVDESVSDLLAEVEAMESLGGGLDSPTSIMKCDDELTGDPKEMTLEFALGLSPMGDAGKGDTLSSTADLHLPSQPTPPAAEPFRHPDVHNHQQRIPAQQHSSGGSEVESTFSRMNWNQTNQFPWDPKC